MVTSKIRDIHMCRSQQGKAQGASTIGFYPSRYVLGSRIVLRRRDRKRNEASYPFKLLTAVPWQYLLVFVNIGWVPFTAYWSVFFASTSGAGARSGLKQNL